MHPLPLCMSIVLNHFKIRANSAVPEESLLIQRINNAIISSPLH